MTPETLTRTNGATAQAADARPGFRLAGFALILGTATALLALVHITQGTSTVNATDILGLLLGNDDAETAAIVGASRVPRLVAGVLVGVALGVFVLHTVEIWLYAAIYLLLPTGLGFEEALYFSTVTYASVGYGDITLPQDWRVFGAIEGANGIILLGWSTAFFVSVVSRLRALEHDWLRD